MALGALRSADALDGAANQTTQPPSTSGVAIEARWNGKPTDQLPALSQELAIAEHDRIRGLHHVTAIVSGAQANLDFYIGVLGVRLAKRTVNFAARDLGGGFEVGRVLPFAKRRMIGPFVFSDHMGPLG
ncbi:MAG TPA: VOC family protein, partial [Acetobacteraceae bacterium]|nr:VOC family protein [Acetobacteraceae bacterium]